MPIRFLNPCVDLWPSLTSFFLNLLTVPLLQPVVGSPKHELPAVEKALSLGSLWCLISLCVCTFLPVSQITASHSSQPLPLWFHKPWAYFLSLLLCRWKSLNHFNLSQCITVALSWSPALPFSLPSLLLFCCSCVVVMSPSHKHNMGVPRFHTATKLFLFFPLPFAFYYVLFVCLFSFRWPFHNSKVARRFFF